MSGSNFFQSKKVFDFLTHALNQIQTLGNNCASPSMRNCLHLIYANMLEKSWKIFGVGQFLLNGKNLSTDLYILQHNYTWYIKDCQQWITWGKARILLPSYNPWKINCSISNMIDIYLQVHKSLWRLEGRKPDMLTSHTTWPQKKKFSLTPQLKFHVYTNFEVELWWWFCTTNWICIQLEREVGKETDK